MVVQSAERHSGFMTAPSVAFRTDASFEIGTGHVMRCLTLAQALKDRGARIFFLSRAHPGNLNGEIQKRGYEVRELPESDDRIPPASRPVAESDPYLAWLGVQRERDAEECIGLLEHERIEWLVVDHYALERSWETRLRNRVGNILAIDDLADRPHDCEVLLDQNFVSDGRERYDSLVPRHCTRLMGPGYALLRKEFAAARRSLELRNGVIRRVLIFFGGADPSNMTGRAIEALGDPDLDHLRVDVVIGPSNTHREQLRRQVAEYRGMELHTNVDNMAELMVAADLALGAGGTTTWERLCVGLPTLVITVAGNQEPSVEALDQGGYVIRLGDQGNVSIELIRDAVRGVIADPAVNRDLQRRGMALVDGTGAGKVADVITCGIQPEAWRIREARETDCTLYWDWANDPETRDNAFQSERIPWETHVRWFHEKLAAQDVTLLLVEADEGPVGQVRFEWIGGHHVISFSLSRQFRGLSLGRRLLAEAIRRFRTLNDTALVGETVPTNQASARIFQHLGFSEVEPVKPNSRRFELAGNVAPSL